MFKQKTLDFHTFYQPNFSDLSTFKFMVLVIEIPIIIYFALITFNLINY